MKHGFMDAFPGVLTNGLGNPFTGGGCKKEILIHGVPRDNWA
jgi:hypothetical protein